MNESKEIKKQHIDDVQTATVDEHFKLIINDKTLLDLNVTSITRDDLPDWYDEKLFKLTQSFFYKNLALVTLNNIIGLIGVFTIPQVSKVLQYSGQTSTVCLAFKRYLQTTIHINKLYTCDPNNSHSDWYRTMNVIRYKHKSNSNKSNKADLGGIYQKDMVLTQFAFMGYILLMPRAIGINMKPEEEEAFNHFWRVMGNMLGIPDRLNLCRKNVNETRKLCQKLLDEVYIDYFNNVTSDFHTLATVSLDSLWYMDFTVDTDAMMTLVYKLHGLKYNKPLGWYSWLNMKYRSVIINLSLVPYVGVVVKTYLNTMLRFIYWYSEHYGTLYAWLSFPKEDLKLSIYSK